MELWIRSQNKHSLIKCDYITTLEIEENNIYGDNKIEYKIVTADDLVLGEYGSEQRLLEVLDEIQDLIKPIMLF